MDRLIEVALWLQESSSPLAPCFPRVDPAPFQRLCAAAVRSKVNSADRETGLCPAAAGYVELCQRAGMELWVPEPCGKLT